jgi:hypothetical protein
LVVQLLWLPGVVKIEVVHMGAAGRDAAVDRAGWDMGLRAVCVES